MRRETGKEYRYSFIVVDLHHLEPVPMDRLLTATIIAARRGFEVQGRCPALPHGVLAYATPRSLDSRSGRGA